VAAYSSLSLATQDIVVVLFFDALINIVQARKPENNRLAPLAEKRLKRLQYWSKHSPINFLGKQFLVEAELCWLYGDMDTAYAKYTCAIALSREGGFIMQTALAHERTCKFLLEQGLDAETAAFHLREASSLYTRWGATAKVKHLNAEIASKLQRS
jgi:hypothetical protein